MVVALKGHSEQFELESMYFFKFGNDNLDGCSGWLLRVLIRFGMKHSGN